MTIIIPFLVVDGASRGDGEEKVIIGVSISFDRLISGGGVDINRKRKS